MAGSTDAPQAIHGVRLAIAGIVLAASNFMVVLDTTIANVSVPHIAGSLGISTSQGIWIITSYSVAEAICVPLTGWLAGRFGAVRTFIFCMMGFGIFSMLCGMSPTLGMLVACRIGQGLCGGPLMPLSQTLLMRIFPPEQRNQAMALWAMTTVVAPILGPIFGGSISDAWSWHWIFFINVPVVLLCSFGAMRMLRPAETPTEDLRVDRTGLVLMIIWIGALQILLDLGRERDWFGDPLIVALGIIAAIFFAIFLVWELTEEQPIVDLRVFRHSGFTVSTLSLALTFGAFFATSVIIPQYLQVGLGYTSTDAGYATSFIGVGAVIMAPIVGRLASKVDLRLLVFGGILWLGMVSWLRAGWTADADFWTLSFPQMVQGFGMPFFFIAATALGLSAVEPRETASAAGVMSFMRTMAGAIGASIATTYWDNSQRVARSEIVGRLNTTQAADNLSSQGFSLDQTRQVVANIVDRESLAQATNHIFLVLAVLFVASALVIWLTPRPSREVDGSAAH